MNGRDAATITATALLFFSPARRAELPSAPVPVVEANDNRHAAGVMRGDSLFVELDVRMARWFPEAADGQFVDTPVIGEVGHAPQIPGPLIRAKEGTTIVARLTNALPDSTVTWHGVSTKPGADSVMLRPGESRTVRFLVGRAGTYVYAVRVGVLDTKVREREQALGAFVVDKRGDSGTDRVFVLNIWGEQLDSATYQNALAINGRAWPFTERIQANLGDTLHWRIVNGSARAHPMHLHGFYFRILERGDGMRDSVLARSDQETVVTETMAPFSTMRTSWVAEREGNWLFHCHLAFHVNSDARFAIGTDHNSQHDANMSSDATRHMSGLVLGIEIRAPAKAHHVDRSGARRMRLLVQEGRPRGRAKRALGFVLQKDAAPAADSIEIPGTPLILTRGQPTDITVVNHLAEGTAVHWHGLELESYSDGVAGWSGAMNRLARPIAPKDSFVAHLTLKRAGTFIYHTHLNDVEQLTSGMYGALVVMEPGERYDPRTDHLFVVGWDGTDDPPHLLVNGDSTPPPRVLAVGKHHRLRFIFIGAVGGEPFTLLSDTVPARWRPVARDGFTLPQSQRGERAARIEGWAGQTYDFDFDARTPGEYTLVAGDPAKPMWIGRLVVR
ncbi:MAG: multicopper oxidase domain-containing protein [bacterium]